MKPAPFEYHRPTTADEVVSTLAELGDAAKVLAGGQSLVPMLALRLGVVRAPRRRRPRRRARRHRARRRRRPHRGGDHPGHDRAVRRGRRRRCRCWPGPRRSSVTSRSATEAPSADRSPTPTRRRSTRPWRSRSTPSSSSCPPTVDGRSPAADFFTGLWTHRAGRRRAARRPSPFPVWSGRCGFAVARARSPPRRLRHRRRGRRRASSTATTAVTRCGIGLLGLGSTPERAGAAEAAATGSVTRRHRRRRDRSAGDGRPRRGAVGPARLGRLPAPGRRGDGRRRLAGRDRGGPPWVTWRSRSRSTARPAATACRHGSRSPTSSASGAA